MTTKEFNNKVTNGFLKYFYAKRQEQYKIYEEEISKQTKNKKVQKNKITKKMNSPVFPLLSEMIKEYENNTDYDKSKDKSFLKIFDANTLNFEYNTVE